MDELAHRICDMLERKSLMRKYMTHGSKIQVAELDNKIEQLLNKYLDLKYGMGKRLKLMTAPEFEQMEFDRLKAYNRAADDGVNYEQQGDTDDDSI